MRTIKMPDEGMQEKVERRDTSVRHATLLPRLLGICIVIAFECLNKRKLPVPWCPRWGIAR